MDAQNDPARLSLIQQISHAETLSEVREAQAALRQWRQQNPQDWGILDAGEELALLEDALMEDDSPPGMSPSWAEWQRLEYQVMGARTLAETHAARHVLRQWVEQRPEETKGELVEMLFLLLEVVEQDESASPLVQKQQSRELAGQAG